MKKNNIQKMPKAGQAGNGTKPHVSGWPGEKYNVLTGLVHSYCKPYRTNVYWKALVALLWRKIRFGRGYIIRSW